MSWSTWVLSAWIALALSVGAASAIETGAQRSDEVARQPVGALPRIEAQTGGGIGPPGDSRDLDAAESPATTVERVAEPLAVRAPRVGLDAPLIAVAKTADGALDVPDFGTAGWYQPGVRPGEVGSAVLAGHVDSTEGPDVFYALRDLEPGDEIVVQRADDTAATFVVDAREHAPKDALPVERIFAPADTPRLTLITCGGAFDRASRSYESNVIVYARLAGDRA